MSKYYDLCGHLMGRAKNDDGRFIKEVLIEDIYKEVRPQKTIIDIGAYQGEFSFYCYPFARKIYAIEPNPKAFSVLNGYVSLYDLENTISCFNIAISGKNELRSINLETEIGGSSIVNGADNGCLKIDTVTINTFLNQNGIDKVDILKIDTESAEQEIFQADDFEDAAKKIDFIIGELHNNCIIKDRLSSLGYRYEMLNDTIFTAKK